MGKDSHIEWTDHTWNPWYGCQKVSAGCKNCYMYRDLNRYGKDPHTVVRSKTTFYTPDAWQESARVFTCSWSDFFIKDADDWRPDAWSVIRRNPHLTFQILTKRPERVKDHLPRDWGNGWDNVWLGTSVESQHTALSRIPILSTIPAKVRFLSCEPLLESVDLHELVKGIHWIIAGGESGPDARPMKTEWVQMIRDCCTYHGIKFFFKQWGGRGHSNSGDHAILDGRLWQEIPDYQKPSPVVTEQLRLL